MGKTFIIRVNKKYFKEIPVAHINSLSCTIDELKETAMHIEFNVTIYPHVLGDVEYALYLEQSNQYNVYAVLKMHVIPNAYGLSPIHEEMPYNKEPFTSIIEFHNAYLDRYVSISDFRSTNEIYIRNKVHTPMLLKPLQKIPIISFEMTIPKQGELYECITIEVDNETLFLPIHLYRSNKEIAPTVVLYEFGNIYVDSIKPIKADIILRAYLKRVAFVDMYVKPQETNVLFCPTANPSNIIPEHGKFSVGYFILYPENYGSYSGELLLILSNDANSQIAIKLFYSATFIYFDQNPIKYSVKHLIINQFQHIGSVSLYIDHDPVQGVSGVSSVSKNCIAQNTWEYNSSVNSVNISCAASGDEFHHDYLSFFYNKQIFTFIVDIPFADELLCSDEVIAPASMIYRNNKMHKCGEPIHLYSRHFADYNVKSCIFNYAAQPLLINISVDTEAYRSSVNYSNYTVQGIESHESTPYILTVTNNSRTLNSGEMLCQVCNISMVEKEGYVIAYRYIGGYTLAMKYAIKKEDCSLEILATNDAMMSTLEDVHMISAHSTYPFNISIKSYSFNNSGFSFNLATHQILENTLIGNASLNYFKTDYYQSIHKLIYKGNMIINDLKEYNDINEKHKVIATTLKICTDIGIDYTVILRSSIPVISFFKEPIKTSVSPEYQLVSLTMYNPTLYTIFGYIYLKCPLPYNNEYTISAESCVFLPPHSSNEKDSITVLVNQSTFYVIRPHTSIKLPGIYIKSTRLGSYSFYLLIKNNITFATSSKIDVLVEKPSLMITSIASIDNPSEVIKGLYFKVYFRIDKVYYNKSQAAIPRNAFQYIKNMFVGEPRRDVFEFFEKQYTLQYTGPNDISIYRYTIGKTGKDAAYGFTIIGTPIMLSNENSTSFVIRFRNDFTMIKGSYNILIHTSHGVFQMELDFNFQGAEFIYGFIKYSLY